MKFQTIFERFLMPVSLPFHYQQQTFKILIIKDDSLENLNLEQRLLTEYKINGDIDNIEEIIKYLENCKKNHLRISLIIN